jgi:hypothetical protein
MLPSPALSRWIKRLQDMGMAGIAGALIEAGAPLAPLLGQILYVAQPTLSLFVPRKSIDVWAEWLDQPANLTALLNELDHHDQPDDKP